MKLSRKYLAFPVDPALPTRKVRLTDGNELLYEMDISLCDEGSFTAYMDVARFIGRDVRVLADGEELFPRGTDTIDRPDLYRESARPYYHFTERNGWHNDPNGLVLDAKGRYHLYFQLNPAAPMWGNMHWGHAVSRDMLSWREEDTALFPDETGTMFSGSALRDDEGAAGFGKGALLFYYTAAGEFAQGGAPVPYTQRLAYSTDDGETLVKWGCVIPFRRGGNRDPKIIRCDELSNWVIPIYLDGEEYELWQSRDLLHWEAFQRVTLPGDAECPDFYPLTADDGTRHWVLSGAAGMYLVGKIEDGKFAPEQAVRAMHGGDDRTMYAAQTVSGLADRRVNIAWERITFPCGTPFAGQMSLPMEHALQKAADGYRLLIAPAKETEALREREITVSGGRAAVESVASEIWLSLDQGEARIDIFGSELVASNGELRFQGQRVPVGDAGELRLFTDTSTLEVFAGETCECFRFDPAGREIILKSGNGMRVWQLKNLFRAE